MTKGPSVILALVDELDDAVLERLADRLAPHVAAHLQPRAPEGEDRWLTARQAAEHLGLSIHALHKLTAARTIPFEQEGPGCRLWFRRSELDRWREQGGTRARRAASTPLPHFRGAAS